MRSGAVALLLLVGFLLAALPTASAAPPSVRPATLGLSLTANPVNGTAPMLVELRATLTPSTISASFDWTFGDSSAHYQETATSYSQVAHTYVAPGPYLVQVFVQSSVGDGNATVALVAGVETLSAAFTATPTTGGAPLTVHFVASPTGGTGTYVSMRWTFGNGDNGSGSDLEYTYPKAGAFNASLNVTDSNGRSADYWTEITVGPAHPNATGAPASTIPPYAAFALPIAVALVAIAAVAVAYRSLLLRRGAEESEAPPPTDGSGPAGPPRPEEGPTTPEAMVEASTSTAEGEDARRLSERILVHLYWYGRPTADGVAPVDASQGGMARRLGVGQNTLSKSLRRLIDSGAVKVELRHVPGAPRRLKTYALTPRGEAVARTVRAGASPPPGR